MLRRIMQTTLQTISPDASVFQIAQKMRKERIGSLLVEEQGEFIGLVTDTAIVREAVANTKEMRGITAEMVMKKPLDTIQVTRNIHDALDMMGDLGVRHLAVCDGPKVVGLVSFRDLLVGIRKNSEPKIGVD